MKPIILKKIRIWLLLTINLLFAFIIGLTIPLLESESSYNLGIIMIPLLMILNYIILDRFHYYLKHTRESEGELDPRT
ncbi:MAG: archaeosortase H N-terminal-like domain-containing protein [Candidatus Odinarchaeota archaeon]